MIGLVVMLPYLALALGYSWGQRRVAEASVRRAASPTAPTAWQPDVDAIVPCYNEEPALLEACLRSLRAQEYRGRLKVWVVDDGSRNRVELLPVIRAESDPAWRVIQLDGNQGKRVAQDAALREGKAEVVLTIDSDTIIEPDAIGRIVAPLHDPRVGAVTGDVRPSNPDASWLTRLIEVRYRLLFQRQRAAQGFFGAVLCCAGPFSAYRRRVVEQVWRRYLGRRFLRPRRNGDDLELTNLVLGEGYRSHYAPHARAATSVPTTLRQYARQQLRWNRSFYRELPRMVALLRGRHPFLALDLAAHTLLPLLIALELTVVAVDAVWYRSRLPWDVTALGLMALGSLGLAPPRLSGRRFAVPYGLLFVGLLLPVRFWALCTLFGNRWGTRLLAGQRVSLSSCLRALRSAISPPFSL